MNDWHNFHSLSVVVLIAAFCITVRSGFYEQASLFLVLVCPYVCASGLSVESCIPTGLSLSMMSPLNAPMPVLFCRQGGALFYEVSGTLTIDTLHVTVIVPGYLHRDTAACHRTQTVFSVHCVYHVSDVVQIKVFYS